MSSESKIDPFAALILVLSLIAIIVMAIFDFMGLYIGGGNYRYSCLDCEYATAGDLAMQILAIIFFVLQIIIALNDLLPKSFIKRDLSAIGLFLAALTIIVVIIGANIFIATYSEIETWPEIGFYFGLIGGIINGVLFFLKFLMKVRNK